MNDTNLDRKKMNVSSVKQPINLISLSFRKDSRYFPPFAAWIFVYSTIHCFFLWKKREEYV